MKASQRTVGQRADDCIRWGWAPASDYHLWSCRPCCT